MQTNLEFIFVGLSVLLALIGLWVFSLKYLFKWPENKISIFSNIVFTAVFICLTAALIIRGFHLNRFPISNLYESLILLAWALAGSFLFMSLKFKLSFLSWPACIVLLGTLIYALLLPASQRELTPLIPALQSYWRAIHVPPLLASYAFFALGALSGAAYLIEQKLKKGSERLAFYQESIYRCISFGFPLLTFGIVTGALWANHAWGNLWQWDPKENLALMTWFCYAAYLHLRLRTPASGTILAWASIVGILATYMTYIGINHLNFGGLHTYGQV